MTYDQFLAKYNNKFVDDDGAYGNQCWDLTSRYAKEVVGAPSLPTRPGGNGGARDCFEIFMSPLPQYFERIANNPNDPNQVPRRGDIIVWGALMGAFGHIAIVDTAYPGQNKFKSFDQNSPVGSNSHLQEHSYYGVLGWLRPKNKGGIVMDSSDANEAFLGWFHRKPGGNEANQWIGMKPDKVAVSVKNQPEWLYQNHILLVAYPDAVKAVTDANQRMAQLANELDTLKKQDVIDQQQLDAAQKKAEQAAAELTTATTQLKKAQDDLAEAQKKQAAAEETGNAFLLWLGQKLREILGR